MAFLPHSSRGRDRFDRLRDVMLDAGARRVGVSDLFEAAAELLDVEGAALHLARPHGVSTLRWQKAVGCVALPHRPTTAADGDLLARLGASGPAARALVLEGGVVAGLPGDAGVLGWIEFPVNVRRGLHKDDAATVSALARQLASLLREGRLREELAEIRAEREQLETSARHDQLTRLANRAWFDERLQNALDTAALTGGRVGVLYLDLDDFKPVNDQYGHHIGDLVLRHVGVRIRANQRAGDLGARLGGDEFAVLLTAIDDPGEAAALGDRLVQDLAVSVDFGPVSQPVAVSVGLAVSPIGGCGAADLLRQADQSMYRAKRIRKARAGVDDMAAAVVLPEGAVIDVAEYLPSDRDESQPIVEIAAVHKGDDATPARIASSTSSRQPAV